MLTKEEAARRAANGAKWLDENMHGNWRTWVNLDMLDMNSDEWCVIGQITGSFQTTAESHWPEIDGRDLGFILPNGDYHTLRPGELITNWTEWHACQDKQRADYKILTAAWRELLSH